jgi:hypothetical protein
MLQLACQWDLAHPAVSCVAPTLIQEAGADARPIESKRAELAALGDSQPLSAADVALIRGLGDNTGCMALKGATPDYDGVELPDRWPLDGDYLEIAARWQIEPEADLREHAAPAHSTS